MEREIEFLRQQVHHLERMVENCQAYISSLEARVTELERRPVMILAAEEPAEPKSYAIARARLEEFVLTGDPSFWERQRRSKR